MNFTHIHCPKGFRGRLAYKDKTNKNQKENEIFLHSSVSKNLGSTGKTNSLAYGSSKGDKKKLIHY